MSDNGDEAGHEPIPGRCNAQKKASRGGGLCKAPAGRGTSHPGVGYCANHLGATKNHVRAAEMQMARQAVTKLDLSLSTDPVSALLDELNRRFRWVAFLEGLVMELPTHPEDDEQVPAADEDGGSYWVRGKPGLYGRVYAVSGIPTGEARPHALVELYERERQQLVRVASECVKANVSQRAMDLAESYARTMAAFATAFTTALGLDPTDKRVREAGRMAMLKAGGVVEGSAVEIDG